jgi:hypothetical protein
MKRLAVTLALFAALASWAAASVAVAAPDVLLDSLRASYEADAPYRNALYLWLRLAGLAWIAVEWVAAFILWRAWRALARAYREMEAARDA